MTTAQPRIFAERGGNVAILFAISLVPLLVGAGVGIDMVRAGQARAQLNDAADAGLLAAARAKLQNDALTDAQLTTIARKYFDANRAGVGEIAIDTFDFNFDAATKSATLTAHGQMKTALLGVVGKPFMDVNIDTGAEIAKPRALEVVLALDNTGSMDGTKIADLRNSAADLVDAIMADTDNEVLVGLVPFARHVQIGMSRAGEPWLAVPPDGSWTENACTVDTPAATAAGCSEGPSTCYYDGVPYSCNEWTCPSGSPPTTCSIVNHPTTWLGCVGSRAHPLNIEDRDFLATPIPGIANDAAWPGDCPNELTPMTLDKAALLAKVAAMGVSGETYVPGGLFWAQALISAEAPFTEGKSYAAMTNDGGVKAIVLMTDGENTASPSGAGDHYAADEAEADAYTTELCDEIKGKGVILYAIAFDVTDAATQTMLRDCATSPDAYFNASDATALSDAFGEIGNNLQELALTR